MNGLKKINKVFRTAIILGILLLSACAKRSFNAKIKESMVDSSAKKVTLDWSCQPNSKESKSSFFTQEEYCQWTRRARTDPKTQALRCEFTTNFDQSRPFFLTKETDFNRYVDNDFSAGKDFEMVYSNSQAFLTGKFGGPGAEVEPKNSRHPGVSRDGIFPTCTGVGPLHPGELGNCHDDITCVCNRKSDPQICAVAGAVAKRKCTVKPVAFKAIQDPKYTKPGMLQNPLVVVQIAVDLDRFKDLAPFCKYQHQYSLENDPGGKTKEIVRTIQGLDPNSEKTYISCFFPAGKQTEFKSCDDVSAGILASASFTFEGGCSADDVASDLNGKLLNACE